MPDRDPQTQTLIGIRVDLSDFLIKLVPRDDLVFEFEPGLSVAAAIEQMARHWGPAMTEALFDRKGKMHSYIMVALDRDIIPGFRLDETILTQDCTLALIPLAIAG